MDTSPRQPQPRARGSDHLMSEKVCSLCGTTVVRTVSGWANAVDNTLACPESSFGHGCHRVIPPPTPKPPTG